MRPETEAELSQAVRDAPGPLTIVGGGTRAPSGNGAHLSSCGLSGIRLYEPGALTLVAGAGTPLAAVQAALAEHGQQLAFEPPDMRRLQPAVAEGGSGDPTIGGVVATNASGPRRIQTGACRDHLLGVRFVDGAGTVIKNGGRVMKNVTGYDLVKLMCGSHGTLGVLSEVALKVLPGAAATAVVRIAAQRVAGAVTTMSQALGSPWDVTGAAHLPGAVPETLIRVEGSAASVSERANKLAALLGQGAQVDTDPDPAIWADVRDAALFEGGSEDVWRISVKPSDAPEVVRRVPASKTLLDWGGGLIWVGVAPGSDVRTMLGGISGHATLVRADATTRARLGKFQPEPAPLASISAGLRAKFDPRGILNPGVMG